MTQEEKAKAYDEAIRKLRGMMPNWERLSYNGKTFLQDLINIFPKLAESEDEKIRKGLIEDYKKFNPMDEYLDGVPFSHVVTWLEKQGASIDVDSILNKVGIKPAYKDGNAWCILYGDNIQDGVCGFGYTKEEALIEFLKDLLEKQGEQKPAWSEEDEKWIKYLNEMLDYNFQNFTKFESNAVGAYSWLKTIKQRIGG